MVTDEILRVEHLTTQFRARAGTVTAVNDVSFSIASGETLGIVGESGSGKSATSLSIMRLIAPPGQITGGKVIFEGRDMLTLSREQMRKLRGGEIAMIFQDPMSSLNPLLTIGRQIAESVMEHQGLGRKAAYARAIEMLRMVGMPGAEKRIRSYPHEFSGGMRQRVVIAMALANNPTLLIADEPTTALDVTIQAQVLDLIRTLSRELNSSVIFITHNLGVIASIATRVVVMYAGRVVETGSTAHIFYRALHPYTHALLASIPRLDQPRGQPFVPIPGQPPDLTSLTPGCPFVPRCPRALSACQVRMPPFEAAADAPDHWVACWNPVQETAV